MGKAARKRPGCKRKRPPHNYSKDAKRMCLAQVGVGQERKGRKKISAYTFAKKGSSPHPSTIYRWKREAKKRRQPDETKAICGRPPKISKVEKMVIGGWVLKRDEEHEQTGIKDIQSFVAENFREHVSKGWVSGAMASLHLTSHRAAMKKRKYRRHQDPKALHTFLLQLRAMVDGKIEACSVVAVDTVRFTHPEAVLRTYGPEGG